MNYEEIYSRSYMKKYDPNFYKDQNYAYETMREWMHEIASFPYVRKEFTTLTLDDEIEELTYVVKNSIDEDYDAEYVKKIFSDGFVICWMRPLVDSILNLAVVVGEKDKKKIQSNYDVNIERLDSLEKKHKKYVRDHGYTYNNISSTV